MPLSPCLSIQELLLLLNILYFPVQTSSRASSTTLCMSPADYDILYYAIRNSPALMQLQLITASSEEEEGAICAAFLNPSSNELIVAFRGTSRGEWLDNFLGGASTEARDRVSTRQQIRALEWYRALTRLNYNWKDYDQEHGRKNYYVTVTGHSKGGNKAKYITILEDSVDRCVSFNGQGFSDEFMEWYYPRIALRRNIVENHNTEYDYVNPLLNDFGKTFYYKNQIADKGFLAGHCANAFFRFEEDGTCTMEASAHGQPEEIKELNLFLNRCLRSMSERERIDLVQWMGIQAQAQADGVPWELRLTWLLAEENLDSLAYLMAYAMGYGDVYPEFCEVITKAAVLFKMEDMDKTLKAVKGMLQWKYFTVFLNMGTVVGNLIPERFWNMLEEYLENKYNLLVTRELLYGLVRLACKVSANLKRQTLYKKQNGIPRRKNK